MHDFTFIDHGSVAVFTPVSEEAHEWVSYHVPEDAPWFGKGFAVEARYAGDVLDGILDDGLTII